MNKQAKLHIDMLKIMTLPVSMCSVTASFSLLLVTVLDVLLLFCVVEEVLDEDVVVEDDSGDVVEGCVVRFGVTNVAPGISRPVMPCTILPMDRAIFEKSKPPATTPGMLADVGIEC